MVYRTIGAGKLLSPVSVLCLFMRKRKKRLARNISACLSNLKHNWFLPISASAFFFLYDNWTIEFRQGLVASFLIWIAIAALTPSMFAKIKQRHLARHAISFMTATGICWRACDCFCSTRSELLPNQIFGGLLPEPFGNAWFLGAGGALVGLYFVYICVSLLEKRLAEIIDGCHLFEDIHWAEITLYAVLISISIVFVAVCFLRSEAFYGTEYLYDIVYTSDSPALLKGNAFLTLTHPENDLRQPLFAVFSAPFAGIPYLLGKLFRVSGAVQAILLGSIHIAILFFANFMLAGMMRIRSVMRACFITLVCSTYTYLLFILMLEQYVIAYFWLILCLYLISEKRPCERIVLWGAGGTLLPSMVLLPFMSKWSPFRHFKEWMVEMGKFSFGFIGFLFAFCRYDLLCGFTTQWELWNRFTGESLSWTEKINQYSAFVSHCIIAPAAGGNVTSFDYASWQLHPAGGVSTIGLLVFGSAIFSAVLNWRKQISRIAGGWVCLSMLILLVWGWGTQENGLILYSLYFGWSYLVLLYLLVERIGEHLKLRMLAPVVSVTAAVVLATINISAIMDLVRFAIANYPT